MDHRTTHYSLLFIIFGVVAAISSLVNYSKVDSTSIWFLATGVLGLIVTRSWFLDGKLARPYDLIVGVIFAVVGVIGILAAFKINLLTTVHAAPYVSASSIFGLSLAFFNCLVYAFVGFTSLNHGIKAK